MTNFDIDEDVTQWVPVELGLPKDTEEKFFKVMLYLPDTIRGDKEKSEELMNIFNVAFKKYCDLVDVDYSEYIKK